MPHVASVPTLDSITSLHELTESEEDMQTTSTVLPSVGTGLERQRQVWRGGERSRRRTWTGPGFEGWLPPAPLLRNLGEGGLTVRKQNWRKKYQLS